MAAITILDTASADVATPASGHTSVYVDTSATPSGLKLKSSSGTITNINSDQFTAVPNNMSGSFPAAARPNGNEPNGIAVDASNSKLVINVGLGGITRWVYNDGTHADLSYIGKTVFSVASTSLPVAGQSGSVIAISDQGGKLAYWDTDNTRWSYVFDNSAVV